MTIGRTIISPTKRLSRPQSRSGIAMSIRSLSRNGLTSPMRLVDQDRDEHDRDLALVRPEERDDPPDRAAAPLARDGLDLALAHQAARQRPRPGKLIDRATRRSACWLR